MTQETQEQTTASVEVKGSTEEEKSFKEELSNPSNEAKEVVSNPETEAKKETKEEPKYTEAEVNRKIQSEADKRVKTYQEENRKLRMQVTEKEDDRDLELIRQKFVGEGEDEDKAKAIVDASKRIQTRVREYELHKSELEDQKTRQADIDKQQGQDFKDIVSYRDALAVLMPEEKGIRQKINGIVARLSKAETKAEYNFILKEIKAEYGGKSFKPDSGRSSGGGGKLTHEQIKKMSPDEKIKRNKEILEFYDKQE